MSVGTLCAILGAAAALGALFVKLWKVDSAQGREIAVLKEKVNQLEKKT